jgi:hypothetical protein
MSDMVTVSWSLRLVEKLVSESENDLPVLHTFSFAYSSDDACLHVDRPYIRFDRQIGFFEAGIPLSTQSGQPTP